MIKASYIILVLTLSFVIFGLVKSSWAVYDLPAARQITWQTGSDIWNGGTLPNYVQDTPCSGINGNGVFDNASAINACITSAAPGHAVYLPAGNYYFNGKITLKSNTALRGAGAANTILKYGTGAYITTADGSVTPSPNYPIQTGYALSGAPLKGDTQLTLSNATQANIDDYIAIYSDDDPSFITAQGNSGYGACGWCGENTGTHLLQQIVKVTNKVGSVITISKPLYYTLYTNPKFRIYNWGTRFAGVEDMKLSGETVDTGNHSFIYLENALHCWVKGIETSMLGQGSKAYHVYIAWSYGCEVRNSYIHDGRYSGSDTNYGVMIAFPNSDHKIENNIMRHNRHSVNFEGGGTGCAILYNYMDDNYTDDLTYLGSARFNHGAHPYMNLFEGNIISHIAADDVWGTSSHFLIFRNWIWGDETGTGVPNFPPGYGYNAVDLFSLNTSYSFVGNVLGATGKHTTWSNATVLGYSPYASTPSAPIVYSIDTSVRSSTIKHGNYDYKTNGVAYWDGGSDHTLKVSIYYSSKPYWFGNLTWPAIGPDLNPMTGTIPAKARYEGQTYPYGGNVTLYGDVSGDNSISAYDASLAAQYAVGLVTLTQNQITAADVSGDGTVSAYDASLIAQKAVGLISKFPIGGG